MGGERYRANFVQVALNVVRREGSTENVLPSILRGYFGERAGHPGTRHRVVFEWEEASLHLRPLAEGEEQGISA